MIHLRSRTLALWLAGASSSGVIAEQLRGRGSSTSSSSSSIHERALSAETIVWITDLAQKDVSETEEVVVAGFESDKDGPDDWAEKFKELQCVADAKQSGQDACLGDPDLKCTWCELSQPRQGIDHLCFPAFSKEFITEKGVTTSCIDQAPPKPPSSSMSSDVEEALEVEGAAPSVSTDWSKMKELLCLLKQTDHDTCLQDASLDCSWCELTQPQQNVDHGCFPAFLTPQMIEQETIKNCDPAPSAASIEESDDELDVSVEKVEDSPFDFTKCWSQTAHDACVGIEDVDCSWCTLATPIAGVEAVCQPGSYADAMVKSGIAKECSSNAEDDEVPAFVSETTTQTFVYNEGSLQHSLEDNTVDPAFCDPKSPKSLSGYVSLDGSQYDGPGEDKHYFYWFFESREKNADENTPFFIWLTGGPGCSSSLALLSENGPCSVNDEGTGTTPNDFSWNNNAHALWLDQPTGVGYSYGKADDSNEDMVGENAYYFLQSFLQSHPEYSKNPLFITGESYAGHYVPAITHRIMKGNEEKKEGTIHLNLQGMAIGNGLTNPEIQYPQYADMAFKNSHGIQVIDAKTYATMKKESDGCTALIHKCNENHSGIMNTFFCQSAVAVCNLAFMAPYQMTGLNPYDIREVCEHPPLCYDFSNVGTFLNSPATKKALHVTDESSKWASCNFGVHSHFMNDWMKDMSPLVADILNNGLRVLVYAGDVDFICNYMGNRAWTLALDWKHKDDFNAAEDHEWNKKTGLAKTSNGFTFLQVYDAGHMVPMNQPKVAVEMINQFFKSEDF